MLRLIVFGRPLLLAGLVGVFACTPPTAKAPAAQWTATSDDGAFTGTVRPESGAPRIGEHQNWLVHLVGRDRQPVYPARIGINGGMPGHGHGLPTKPKVTEHLGDGRYRIEGLRFNMAGRWTLLLLIETPNRRGRVQFELDLDW